MGAPLVAASIEAYNRISAELLPTPAKSHYTFNMRDLAKVCPHLACPFTAIVLPSALLSYA
jgi:hypothetical protein